MWRTENEWVSATFVFLIFLKIVASARECCPSDAYLVYKSKICSDNKTFYNISCIAGYYILDPFSDKNDTFSIGPSGNFLLFDGSERIEEFCLGRIQRNAPEIPKDIVALVCFNDEFWAQKSDFTSIILRFLMLISTACLIITLYVYTILPNLRDLQGKCIISFICCLVASYVTLFVAQTFSNSSHEACIMQAAALYFFLTSTFFWNNIITFNIWKAVRNISSKMQPKTWCLIYMIWGFGVPLTMVLLSFILEHVPGGNHVRPQFAETRCWFKGDLESWNYFYGPILVLIILNTIMFLHCSWTHWKSYRGSNVSRIRSLRFKYLMYLKLFLLMGITWIFEVVSFATKDNAKTKYLWFCTDCLNSAQGILIFLVLVVFRQKVRLGLLHIKLFNINWPQSWAKEELEESSGVFFVEDVELANQKMKMVAEPQ